MKALGNVLARLNSSTSRSKTVPQAVVEEHVPDSARRVLDHLANAIATTDAAGNLTYLNHAAEQLVGHELADAYGLPLATVLPLRNELTDQAIRLPALPRTDRAAGKSPRTGGRRCGLPCRILCESWRWS